MQDRLLCVTISVAPLQAELRGLINRVALRAVAIMSELSLPSRVAISRSSADQRVVRRNSLPHHDL